MRTVTSRAYRHGDCHIRHKQSSLSDINLRIVNQRTIIMDIYVFPCCNLSRTYSSFPIIFSCPALFLML